MKKEYDDDDFGKVSLKRILFKMYIYWPQMFCAHSIPCNDDDDEDDDN